MVIARLKQKLKRILEESGINCADFETEQLLKWCIGERYYITDSLEEIGEEWEQKLTEAAVMRAKGEPLQYIIGEWDFYGYTFKVGQGVLIPRQETEVLVEKTLPFLNERTTVIDLCSGSGCIPIAIAKKSKADCYGVEISKVAISYFEENVKLNNTENKVRIVEGDVLNRSNETLNLFHQQGDLITA
ncbi:MAG: 50S ribosomal protein L11 methyltransferase, partial [Ruminiclostridium sp.]|nr:50S ribosomal protein L11 methyltransferase [Ruminiclostridium sp.]